MLSQYDTMLQPNEHVAPSERGPTVGDVLIFALIGLGIGVALVVLACLYVVGSLAPRREIAD